MVEALGVAGIIICIGGMAVLLAGYILSLGVWTKPKDGFDREYDALIQGLVRGGMLELNSTHTVKAGDLKIWIANYPGEKYGSPYDCGVCEDLTVSVATRRMLHDHVKKLHMLLAFEKARKA